MLQIIYTIQPKFPTPSFKNVEQQTPLFLTFQLSSIIIKNSCLPSTVMKATPYLEEVFHLIIRLLNDQGHEQMAEQLAEIYPLPQWIETNNPLLKKGLTKIVKDYVKNNEKMLRYYQNRTEEQPEQEINKKSRKRSVDSHRKSVSPKHEIKIKPHAKKPESPVVAKVASPKQAAGKTSSWMSKFQKPKTLEELNEVAETVQEVIKEQATLNHSKPKKQKKAKIESSQYESEEDSFELEPKKKHKKQAKQEKKVEKAEKKKKKPVKSQSEEEEESQKEQEKKVAPKKKQEKPVVVKNHVQTQEKKKPVYESQTNGYYGHNGYPKQAFSRINPDEVGPIREQLRDNSFQAKAKFGQQADHWGQFGYDKLKDTRGDSFKKTKGKLKNRAFQGALMDINKINSIPIA